MIAGKRFCPNCGSEDIEMMDGGVTGSMQCQDCGFYGTIFPERTFIGEGDEADEDEGTAKIIKVKKSSKKKSLKNQNKKDKKVKKRGKKK